MRSSRSFILPVAAIVLSLSMFNFALAEEDIMEDDPMYKALMEGGEQCLSTRSITRTDVMHDQAILFYVRGSAIYVNVLPKPCKRLSKGGRFMYESSISRLCRGEHIRILQDDGLGLSAGRACRIGGFHPITKEQVDEIMKPRTVDPQPIPPAEAEQPEGSDPAASSGTSDLSEEIREQT